MHDALCDKTWTGPQKLGFKVGYICQKFGE